MEDGGEICGGAAAAASFPAEIPRDPMELLSRSWSISALEVSKTLAPTNDFAGEGEEGAIAEEEMELETVMAMVAGGNPFSFSTSATSQLVLERIMAQSEVSPRTSGRLSHSSGPLNGGHSCGSLSDSPPVSPSDADDLNKYTRAATGAGGGATQYRGGSKTVGRWLKDRKERKKEETRIHNAQVHAAVSLASVAAAVAAIAAAAAVSSRTDMAVASAATLVAAQCVDSAEALGAPREQLAAAVSSAVNVRSPGDIITLTAAAATALRAATTLKARTMKDVWNVAAVTPLDKAQTRHNGHRQDRQRHHGATKENLSGELADDNFLGLCSRELLSRGTELLKRTRKGALHWKVVSVYVNKTGQVMLKMKSRHVAGAITKKKKNVVVGVRRDVAAWPERRLLDGREQRRYFGLKTAEGRVIEFECRSQREHDLWTSGVERLLTI